MRGRLFRSPDPHAPPRIGLEAEVIPIGAATGRPCPIEPDPRDPDTPASGPVLVGWAGESEGAEIIAHAGAPAVRLESGAVLSFEPGGQLEYSTAPAPGGDALLADLESVLEPLARRAAAEGIRLLARGMDPVTPVERTRLRLAADRYRRMDAHYAKIGPAGRRMMRQTAALHVNVDLGPRPRERWWVANAVAPLATALFANSPVADDVPTGHRSTRSLQWRRLDPGRTGLRGRSEDPESDYLDFALNAPAFLLGDPGEPVRPFSAWLLAGASFEDWQRHLTTLFPEVRPRGYLEVRCLDALPLRWYGAPVALLAGLLYHGRTLERALELLPPPDPDLLERAGRTGLGDPEVRRRAGTAVALALEGLEALEDGSGGYARCRAVLEDFARVFVARGLDPGSDPAADLLD